MTQKIANFTVKADGNHSLIMVYKGTDLIKGISCNPANLKEKFKATCQAVENHVNKTK